MQTIGERLEEARKKKGISIREAAEATKIRGDYLQRFESNHFDIGLTEIYTRGFLRTYANFLKLPADRIINDYAALGRTEPRPRQPNREVYGRMDISVSTSEEKDGPAPAPEAPAEAPAAASQPQGQPKYPRSATSLPTGPDPALVFKYVKWGGIGLIAIVAVLLLWNLFSSDSTSPSASNRANGAAVGAPSFGLVAIDQVQVKVHRANPDGSDGEQLFFGTLAAGENRTVPRPGPVFIEANAAENLLIELNGRRHNLGQLLGNGAQRGQLPGP